VLKRTNEATTAYRESLVKQRNVKSNVALLLLAIATATITELALTTTAFRHCLKESFRCAEPQDSVEAEAGVFDHERVKDHVHDESSEEVTPGDSPEKVEKHVDKAIQEDEADDEAIRQTNDGDGPKEYCD